MATKYDSIVADAVAAHFKAAKTKPTAAPVDIPTVVVPKVTLLPEEGQTMFSSVFGYTPKMGDFPVTVLPTDAATQRYIPSADVDYVVQQDEAALLVAGIEDGDKTLITGPTGSGKSSLVKYVCAKLNRPFIRINMSGDVESASMFGQQQVRGGATVWEDGAITEAVKMGAVCLVDEWELMSAEITMGLQNLLEDGGYLYLKEKPGTSDDRTHVPHDNFRLVFAGNTVGQGDESGAFSGVGVQNTATIDRFTNTIRLDYLEARHEVAILTDKAGVDGAVATRMVQLASLIRQAYNAGKVSLTMSPRTLLSWARKFKRYDVAMAFNVSFLAKLNDGDKASVQELYNKVFG
jgi:cobaltochelatase CobS